MKKSYGFSLIEVVVVMGILSVLVSGTFFIGLPEYNRYIISTERDQVVDSLLESRARALATSSIFIIFATSTKTGENGFIDGH